MINIFNVLRDKLNKPLLFGIYGGLGCLLTAILLGEIFLDLTKLPPSVRTTNQAIAVLMDTSGSMSGGKLDEAKRAALEFVQRRDLSKDQLSVVHFGDTINIDAPLTGDRRQLDTAISNLSEAGGTPMAEGIEASISVLKNVSKQNFIPSILLFTDGQPDSSARASLIAQTARGERINIIAVATGDADVNYLASITGDPKRVFYANSGQFDQAFQKAESLIYSQQLLESKDSGDYSLIYSLLRTGGWTALLTLGISTAVIIGQNHYLRRRLLTWKEAGIILVGSAIAGFSAGGGGQLLFSTINLLPNSTLIGGILNWGVAGGVLAGIFSFMRPNLKPLPTILQGAMLAMIAATAFMVLMTHIGDAAIAVSAIILGIGMGYITRFKAFGWFSGILVLVLGYRLFAPFTMALPTMEILGRLLGWTLLGAVIGVGISFFIPNLRSGRALFGGSLGGALGAIGFLAAALLLADQPGRLLGASIIGFGIGMMIFWEEERQLQSNSHLLVHWNATETSKILLGKEPIWLGSSADAQIPLSKSKYAPLTAKIFKQENQVIIEFHPDYAQQTGIKVAQQELLPGKRRTFAEISLEIVDEIPINDLAAS